MGGKGSGGKRTPAVLALLKGNPGKRRITDEATADKGTHVPDPPDWLSDEAAEIWKGSAKSLWDLGLLTLADHNAFAAYCDSMATYREARSRIRDEGMVLHVETAHGVCRPMVNPYCSIARDSLSAAMKIGANFGLTPAQRIKGAESADDDPLAEMAREQKRQQAAWAKAHKAKQAKQAKAAKA